MQLHHDFSSAFWIDFLSSFGYCSSYSEVLKLEEIMNNYNITCVSLSRPLRDLKARPRWNSPLRSESPKGGSQYQLGELQSEASLSYLQDSAQDLDLLWLTARLFKESRPSWNSAMHANMTKTCPGKWSVQFEPFLDCPTSNESCIYSIIFIHWKSIS